MTEDERDRRDALHSIVNTLAIITEYLCEADREPTPPDDGEVLPARPIPNNVVTIGSGKRG